MERSELWNLIDKYYADKKNSDDLKKQVEDLNKTIKSAMVEVGEDVIETDNYRATRSVSVRSNIDEDAWLRILKEQAQLPEGIIKTKEYIDMDAFEDAIYNGHISKDTLLRLNEYKKDTEVVTLKVTKRKKGS